MSGEAECGRRGSEPEERCHDNRDLRDGDTEAPQSTSHESKWRLARDTVYQLLAVRSRSHAELMEALRRKDIDVETAQEVLRKFVDAGLVDDAAFAEQWVRSRQRNQGLGRKALAYELRRKGVDELTVSDALSTMDEDVEAERARGLIQRMLAGMAALDHATKMRRLLGMLARKGYSESMAFRIVREEIESYEVDWADNGGV